MNQVFSDKNQETQVTGQQTQAPQMSQNMQDLNQKPEVSQVEPDMQRQRSQSPQGSQDMQRPQTQAPQGSQDMQRHQAQVSQPGPYMQNQRSQTQVSQMSQNMQGQNPQNQQYQRPQMSQGMQGQYVQPGQNMQGQFSQRPQMDQSSQRTYSSQAPQLQKSDNQNFTAYQSMQRQESSSKKAEKPEDKNGAGFFIRLAAYLIDAMIVGAVLLVVGTPVWFMQLSMGDHAIFKNILFEYNIFDILKYLLVSAYFIVTTYTSERTIGKMLMKIRVKSEISEKLTFSQVVFREVIGKYLSGILYIGYIMIGITDKKKGLHDKLADTRVVYEVN